MIYVSLRYFHTSIYREPPSNELRTKPEKMKISIITACYNSQDTIEDTLQSVLSQTYPDIEYIVVDGQSKDGTMDIINKYADQIDHIICEPDKGIYDAINKGIKSATGDIIGLLHSDDVYMNEFAVAKMAGEFKSKNVDSVYADLIFVDRNNINVTKRYWKSANYVKGLFLKGWMPAHPTFFAKKSLFDQLGQYNLKLSQSADYELMLRFLHKYGISTSYVPEVIIKMRLGGKSNFSIFNRIKANLEDRLAWELNDLQPNFMTLIKKPLSKVGQFVEIPQVQPNVSQYFRFPQVRLSGWLNTFL